MSDLFGTLSMAARALEAQRFGLEVAGHNIANVNTPGYTRRTADLSAVAPTSVQLAGRGVMIDGVRAAHDALLEARLRDDLSTRDFYTASDGLLAQIEAAVGLPGQSIDAEMARFFDAFARLAEDPTSTSARLEVQEQGESVASSFRSMADQLDRSQREADRHIRQEVAAINELAERIAVLNGDMSNVPSDREPLHERDQVVQAIRELSEHLDIVVIEGSGADRSMTVYFGSGRPLVVGDTAYSLDVVSVGPGGLADIEHQGISVTAEISEGQLGGFLHVRDSDIPTYVAQLDQLAYTLAQEVNILHDAGYDLNGADAGNFFTPIGAVTGAAAALTVDPPLAADLNLIAAAAVPEPGDNQVARQISDLRDLRVVGGTSTLNDAWGQLAFQVGSDAATASAELEVRSDAARQSMAAWDSLSAVSLDEEAFQITRFQSAYEANAVLFRTVNETIDSLMRMVGV